jgi:hypothetical protein
MRYQPILLATCAALAIVSCKQKAGSDAKSETANTTPITTGVESIMLKSEPADALSIAEIRKSVEPGQTITLAGKVIGNRAPFVEGRAMVVLGDPAKLTSCDLRPEDACTTPWDVCCDDPGDIKNFTATIQVIDADGKLIKQGLKGINGIKELSQLIITGTIADGSNADNLLVNATGIYVKP